MYNESLLMTVISKLWYMYFFIGMYICMYIYVRWGESLMYICKGGVWVLRWRLRKVSADLELTSREKFQASRLDLRRRWSCWSFWATQVQGPDLIGLLIIAFNDMKIRRLKNCQKNGGIILDSYCQSVWNYLVEGGFLSQTCNIISIHFKLLWHRCNWRSRLVLDNQECSAACTGHALGSLLHLPPPPPPVWPESLVPHAFLPCKYNPCRMVPQNAMVSNNEQ